MDAIDVVILANGLSTRLDCEPPYAKTLTAVAERPILDWLLSDVRDVPVVGKIKLYVRPGVDLPEILQPVLDGVEVHRAEPAGYFRDAVAAQAPLTKTVIIDSDLSVPPGSVRSFILSFALSECDLALGYQYVGDETRGRDIWIRIDPSGTVGALGRGLQPTGFATVGIFGWGRRAYDRAVANVGSEHSVTKFLSDEVSKGLRVVPVPFASAVNVNSADDVNLANDLLLPVIAEGGA
ncbi:hypothetical protein IT072_04390 [Leifsonia sp. ZF2019]|uniref:hypothetical protein n=1 Tax=Leifsonia sp. ZF2019 TaxID=2781978 RepID=UPI001CBE5A0B|nr:hypothetical protein [Leifsonia sp. ZF2019]UAJ80291.1 hypothetical protein IT072_04390 [Leifsonia sp. ZF2019]